MSTLMSRRVQVPLVQDHLERPFAVPMQRGKVEPLDSLAYNRRVWEIAPDVQSCIACMAEGSE